MMREVLLLSVVFALGNAAPQRNTLRLDGKIVGGQAVDIKDFPYQVSINILDSHICGAVIIAPFFMLTAGHCVEFALVYLSYTTVRVGSSFHASGGLYIRVQRLYLHPQYNAQTLDYDVGIIQLPVGLGSGVGVSSVALPHSDQEFPAGTMSVVSGWGYTLEAGNIPDQLQAVEVPIVDLEACRAAYGSVDVTPRMLCAGVTEGGLDACQGDSGGPLVIDGVLVGLVSWGLGCARPDYPGVYTNVAAVRSFIKEIANI